MGISATVSAQNINVKGTVTDKDGLPVIGATPPGTALLPIPRALFR